MHEKDIVFREEAREYYPEKMPVGTLIAFKPARGGVRLRAAPVEHATIVVFTGVWQERLAEQEYKTKRVRLVSGKRCKKSNDKTDGPRE